MRISTQTCNKDNEKVMRISTTCISIIIIRILSFILLWVGDILLKTWHNLVRGLTLHKLLSIESQTYESFNKFSKYFANWKRRTNCCHRFSFCFCHKLWLITSNKKLLSFFSTKVIQYMIHENTDQKE